ncbi:MAG: TonB-dependent receptor [Flavobacterium psychrophilum]|nr:MAG: TonB-dependent receptor [Flavobacterium psychrophilum]
MIYLFLIKAFLSKESVWLYSFTCLFFSANFLHGQSAIKGTVIASGKPVSDAFIILSPINKTSISDNNGHFSIENLSYGEYTLTISSVGFKDHTQIITLKDSNPLVLSITLETGIILNEVSLTRQRETKSPDNLINAKYSAMPVTVIDRNTIALMGSRRLDEVLKEQTGLAIVNNIGGGARSVGLQMQGFGSEYIMILIDGQPMVGRNSGNFDLSRISVSNIERIEIIKGASSSLYGSEALGGTINIITRHGVTDPQLLASVAYGSLNIVDATIDGETPILKGKGSANMAANYYSTDGFNTNTRYINGTTSPPYDNYSLQGRTRYQSSEATSWGISGRYGLRRSFMEKDFGLGNTSGDNQDEQDLNLGATFDHKFSDKLRGITRYYFTYYSADMSVAWQQTNSTASQDIFRQTLHRAEQQFAFSTSNSYRLVGGLGGSIETMNDNALTDIDNLSTFFSYIQGDYRPFEKLELVGGLRYDHTNNFGGSLNPSGGIQYHISPKTTLKAGVGTGFKAPDFKTNYLVFYNPAANYLIIGNAVLGSTLEQLQQQGQISEIRQYVLEQADGNLQAEKSTSYNIGAVWDNAKSLKLEGSAFYHSVRNQINSIQVATGTNNGIIYTYQNLPKAVYKGFEFSAKYTPIADMELSAGYQFLIAKDLSVKDSIRAGRWPYNQNIHDPATGNSYAPKVSDYWGIENRSRHMFNIRAFYTYKPWDLSANIRVNYRGKYPFGDRNGNHFIDKYDTFVAQYYLINAAIEKKLLQRHLSLRISVDNLFDYTDPLMPGQPGRIILAGISYRFFKDI